MDQCPKCLSKDIHRSRSKSRWENWRKEITGKRPYRCRACNWRGWGRDTGPTFDERDVELATRAVAPPEPAFREGHTIDWDPTELDPLRPSGPTPEQLDLPQ